MKRATVRKIIGSILGIAVLYGGALTRVPILQGAVILLLSAIAGCSILDVITDALTKKSSDDSVK